MIGAHSSTNEMSSIVSARSLSKTFAGGVAAVADLSLSVAAGEVLGLLGPNGAGKTTLLRMLCGLLAPTAGAASVAGADIAANPADVRARIGYMAQGFALYGDLSVRENITYFAGLYGLSGAARHARIEQLLARLELTDYAERRAEHLSGGLQRRLALAAALPHQPRVLFLDEPTAGVDPVQRSRLWNLIYEIAAEGTTVVVTTHYMDEAERCRRVGLITAGRLVALDAPERLRAGLPGVLEVRTAQVETLLLAERTVRDRRLAPAQVYGQTLRLVLCQGRETMLAVRAALLTAGCAPFTGRSVEPTLEDVFLLHSWQAEQAAAEPPGSEPSSSEQSPTAKPLWKAAEQPPTVPT